MSAELEPPVRPATGGATVVEVRALKRLALGIVLDAAQVPMGDADVDLFDDRGALRVSVTVPVALGGGRSTISERSDDLREAVIFGMRDLASRRVGVVDVRYAGVRRMPARRVS